MENLSEAPVKEPVLCTCCYVKVSDDDTFCNNCGYPLQGTEQEQKTFIANRTSDEIDLEFYEKNIKRAGQTLYWVAASCVLTGFLYYAMAKNDDEGKFALLVTNLVLAVVYVALGAWSKKMPLAALISGFALYGIITILNLIFDPLTMSRGIIIKIAIVVYFIKGIKSAVDSERIKKSLNIQ